MNRDYTMQSFVNASKKETHLTLEVNISQSYDQCLRNERERRWQQDHADFFIAYNKTVADEGLSLDLWRSF